MTEKKINARLGILVAVVFLVALCRLIPYLFNFEESFNFSPLTAVALFGGAYFTNRASALFFPLMALWISNLILDNVFLAQYYEGFALFANWEVYVAIVAIVGLAILLLKKVTLPRVIGVSLLASVLFFIVTNFMVWLSSGMYAPTFGGLVECYTLAIPFFKNTLVGDLVFSLVLFGTFEWVVNRYPSMQSSAG